MPTLLTSADLAEHPHLDHEAVLDLIVRHQQSPRTACAFLGTDAPDIRADLEGLDQHWTQTLRVAADSEGRLRGAVVIEWDEEMDRSWVYGPWLEAAADDDGDALLAAALDQAGVSGHEMFADEANTAVRALAERAGWEVGESNAELVRTAPAPSAEDPEVRAAHEDDLAGIADLHESAFPSAYARTAELVDGAGDYRTLVLDVAGAVLGYLTFQEQGEDTVYVDFVAVDPAARRRGVGRRLIEAAQRATGRGRVALTVDERRTEAEAFYRRTGFEVRSTNRPYRLAR